MQQERTVTVIDDLFNHIAPFTYWVIVALWTVILLVFFRKYGRIGTEEMALKTLVFVLAIDAARTLFENLYFGIYFNSLYGWLPSAFQEFLSTPTLLALPKLVNIAAAIIVLLVLIRRWFPEAEQGQQQLHRALNASEHEVLEAHTRETAMRNQFIDAMESIPDGLALLDADMKVIATNRRMVMVNQDNGERSISGLSIQDWLRDAMDFSSAGGLTAEQLAAKLLSGTPLEVQLVDGTWAMLTHRKSPTENHILVATDISAIKQREQEAIEARMNADEANQAKSTFLANMSHELRTPLNAIIGFSDIMRQEMFGAHSRKEYREYADDIHRSGNHLLQVIESILDLAKIESGRVDLKLEPIDPAGITEEVTGLLFNEAAQQGLAISSHGTKDCPAFLADRLCVRQMLINLVGNAIKFTPAGGRIRIRFAAQEGGVTVAVEDTGPGMTEAQIDALAQPIVIADRVDIARSNRGAGMGLSIVKGLIEAHDGSMTVSSKPNLGTKVVLTFPLQVQPSIDQTAL
ncbi:sensor histidine kinase [Oceanibaculum nanhaiense]|uniref:sensor histidine kinase n=1 Tax=Oceanibaculum nanhaiense TaxID=1909734 RepID=UPI000A39D549|nr:ATP-binding protein [Oceanibaculum nanhaiense]